MNTLFEKFKAYELTAEQAEKVRGGQDVLACSCISGVGTWYYPSGNIPSPGQLTEASIDYCGGVTNTSCRIVELESFAPEGN